VAAPLPAPAEEPGLRLEPAPAHRLDIESLQRGARNFANYCANCHSAQYMRYNRLMDLGIGEKEIRDNLMFATDKVGSAMIAGSIRCEGIGAGSGDGHSVIRFGRRERFSDSLHLPLVPAETTRRAP